MWRKADATPHREAGLLPSMLREVEGTNFFEAIANSVIVVTERSGMGLRGRDPSCVDHLGKASTGA